MHICFSSTDTLCKQFGPRSGHDQNPYHLNFFENVDFQIKSAEHSLNKFLSMQRVKSDGFTPGRGQSKTPILSSNVDKKSIETEFLIAICRQSGDKWQSKTLFLSNFDPRLLIVDSVFDCRLPGVGL